VVKSRRVRRTSRPGAQGATDGINDTSHMTNHRSVKASPRHSSPRSRPLDSPVAVERLQSLEIALTSEEAQQLRQASRARGVSVQRFLREALSAAASKVLGDQRPLTTEARRGTCSVNRARPTP
jgi:uncharacterized protein (DUF1778 family)